MLAESAKAEDDLVWVLESAKNRPSPIDAYFGGVYYIGPIFTAFRGTKDAVDYYRLLRNEVATRVERGLGPITPEGELGEERFRIVVEGPPNWTDFRAFWKMFADEGAVAVASTYTKVGGVYDNGFRHDPDHPLETLADYCMGCYTNLNLPSRVDMLTRYVKEYHADGVLVNSIKSCNSFSAGQLMMLREVGEPHRSPGWFHRERSGGPALLLALEHQEPTGVVLPDDRAEAIRGGRMKYCVGIDLGSTTTKAVILGEEGQVLGRGITNSRSNYKVACDVALSEALVDARFNLVLQGLDQSGLDEAEAASALRSAESPIPRAAVPE